MKKKLLCKCLITFGFLLFFTFLLPFTSAKATTTSNENEKNDYRLNLKSITLVKDKSYTLKVYNSGDDKVLFKSSDVEIASVSEDGVITANKVGTTVVTATVIDGANKIPLTCDVTVGLPAFSVKLTKSRVVLGLDGTDFLNVILKPSNTVENARFSSKDSSIVSVSPAGRLTAKKYGLTYVFAMIEASYSDGTPKYSRCAVIVTSPTDAPILDAYFSNHPELDYISEDDLTKALDEYFNTKYDPNSSTSLDKSLNRYLDDKFNLADYRAKRDADLAKIQ